MIQCFENKEIISYREGILLSERRQTEKDKQTKQRDRQREQAGGHQSRRVDGEEMGEEGSIGKKQINHKT